MKTEMNNFDTVFRYRGKYYYRSTLPSEAINRTLDGYFLYRKPKDQFDWEVIPIGDDI